MLEQLKFLLPLVILAATGLITATRLQSKVHELSNSLESLRKELNRRDTYVEVVELKSEVRQLQANVKSLWSTMNTARNRNDDRFNQLREKLNGGNKWTTASVWSANARNASAVKENDSSILYRTNTSIPPKPTLRSTKQPFFTFNGSVSGWCLW